MFPTDKKSFVRCCQCSREAEMVADHHRFMRPPDGWLEVLVNEAPIQICPRCIVPEPRITSLSKRGLSGLWLHEKP